MNNNNIDQEIWKDIKGYEGRYRISNHGRVYSNLTEKILKNIETTKGYLSVVLRKDNKSIKYEIHRLVAINFIKNPYQLPVVNHKDENPKNNHVNNLEWCTVKYNLYYSYYRKHGKYPNPRNRNITGKPLKRKIIGKSLETGNEINLPSISSCVEYGFARSCVKDCLSGKQKTHKGYIWKYAN